MPTETMSPPSSAKTSPSCARQRLQGCLVLASVAVTIWALFALLEPPPPTVQHLELSAPDGSVSVYADATRVRVVLARSACRFDPGSSILELDPSRSRVVPGNAAVILVEDDGSFSALRRPVPQPFLLQVTRAIAAGRLESLAEWFRSDAVQRSLAGADRAVTGFWN